MRIGDHQARTIRSKKREGFQPRAERLEIRQLMAIDVANIALAPYGVQEVGLKSFGGVGFSVAEVGDVNGDGFNDYLIGAPTVAALGTGPTLGSGSGGQAYLIFGSKTATTSTITDWLTLVTQQRTGDLSTLGQLIQNNPTNGAPGFAFDGLTFVTGQNPNSALGASVAGVGDVNGDGFPDFLIGAPGARDFNNNLNSAGRAYLVYGGTNLVRAIKTVDFDNPTANSDLNVVTFVNNQINGATGRSVAPAGNIFSAGSQGIAIGAPNASVNGLGNSGAVYVISGAALRPAATQTINLQSVGQGGSTNVSGVILTGANAGDRAGFSVAFGGNFAGQVVNSQPQASLLIGSPQFNSGSGYAALVYATPGLISSGIVSSGVSSINLNRIGATTLGIPGAIFVGDTSGDQTGYAVATAGDFNGDTISDILIGSPGFNGASGRVNMIFGRSGSSTAGPINGIFTLAALPTTVSQVELDGQAAGALAGFAVTATGSINNDNLPEILIGSPGFNNSQGQAYLIPGNPDLVGVFNLSATEASPIQGLIISSSLPPGNANYFGASVSGLIGTNGSGHTVDSDVKDDFIIGSPGFALNSSRLGAGSAFMLEGAFVPLPNVVSTAITSPIGVSSIFPPFAINATSPASLKIYILSKGSNVQGFQPFRDIDPTTITLNGVALPDPTTWTQEADLDGDGIPDASFVFSPRSLLNLSNGTVLFTVAARTLPTSPFPSQRYSGTANVTVNGGTNGGGGNSGGLPSDRIGAFANLGALSTANLPFGERLVPSVAIFKKYSYKPIPITVLNQQYLPTNGFSYRTHLYYFPQAKNKFGVNSSHAATGGSYTLRSRVFKREKFPTGTFRGHITIKTPHLP